MFNGIKGGKGLQKSILSGFFIGSIFDYFLDTYPLLLGIVPCSIAIFGYVYLCIKYGRKNLNL